MTTNKQFSEFRVGDIFEIKGMKQAKKQGDIPNDSNGIPYVIQSKNNNMVSRHVNRQYLIDNNEPICEGNTIVLGVTLPAVSYQPLEFGASQVITARSNFLNEKIGLYFVALFKKQMNRFSFQQKPGIQIYKDMVLKLPVVDGTTDVIDFDYMEQVIIGLEEKIIEELEIKKEKSLEAYQKITNMIDYHLTESDMSILTSHSLPPSENNIVSFNSFSLERLFEHSTGDVDLQQKDINGKGCFFINSGRTNNGIKGKTDKPAKIFPTNTISIDFWGNAYYRDFEYKMATHNHVFSLTGDVIKNENVGLYLVGLFSKFPYLFSRDNMATWDRLKILEIELPINKITNEIDFDYMEQYIRAVKKIVINEKIEHLNNIIKITKKVISE